MDFINLTKIARKYAKRLLTRMEESGIVSAEIRKAVLDELNSMAREIAAMHKEHD